jgi:hypothetical protein
METIIGYIITIIAVIGIVGLMVYAFIRDIEKDTSDIKADTPNEHALPSPSNFEQAWNKYHNDKREAEICYNNRPPFPREEKQQIEIMYDYLIRNPYCDMQKMFDWICDTYKDTPGQWKLEVIYYRWCDRGVLPHRRYLN